MADNGISIHALREESDIKTQSRHNTKAISIHALREESDHVTLLSVAFCNLFQSTLSVRRATSFDQITMQFFRFQSTLSVRRATDFQRFQWFLARISIHALREESDLVEPARRLHYILFQSTLSVRRATISCTTPLSSTHLISIHALREESDKTASHIF